jgi:putative RNA 2'-phosphotransferase
MEEFMNEKMINEKQSIKLSKFLSLVLRHKPETIGIELDKAGWTDVSLLIKKCKATGIGIDFETLKHIVETNPKKRFSFNQNQRKIRANQGHSIEIELGYAPQAPPVILYHGTGKKSLDSILKTGLEKRERHHVHLSEDIATALKVGQRHGEPVVLEVLAAQMASDNFIFYRSDNGVWLTDNVSTEYLRVQYEVQ